MNSIVKDILLKYKPALNQTVHRTFRTKGVIIGKPPGVAPTLNQVLERLRQRDQSLYYKVDIGLPYNQNISNRILIERRNEIKNSIKNKELEKLARNNELIVPLDDVFDEWVKTNGPGHIKRIADHYSVFDHLFKDAYFYPVSRLNIVFKVEDEYAPVYYGNRLKPNETKEAPIVEIQSKPDTFHTLIFTNLDGHLNTPGKEYVHWFIGNIPDGDITKGETIYSYLQPFPAKGTGYHRLVFVLYEHTKKMDYSSISYSPKKFLIPDMRNFSTFKFYRDRQDDITPVGLAFFQSDWDSSVTEVFHKTFQMPEPRFEYKFRRFAINPPVWFPKKQPFNVYLDRYRDPKEISKEFLIKKLKDHNPFQKPEPPLKYPHAHSLYDCQNKPSWLQIAIKKERLGWGKPVNDNLDILYPK